jgi:hypothetical protein
MRPREIQSRIRAGESVEQVAAAAGVPPERVERFAYPVLLERSRTAELAQRAHPVREDGPDVQELGEVVSTAFAARGQDYSVAIWDSWKGEDGKWIVQLTWTAGRSNNHAHWSFHPGAHGGTVTPLDDHAHDLLDPNPNRQLRTVRPVTELAAQALALDIEVAPAVEHRQVVGGDAPRTEQDFVQDIELTDDSIEAPVDTADTVNTVNTVDPVGFVEEETRAPASPAPRAPAPAQPATRTPVQPPASAQPAPASPATRAPVQTPAPAPEPAPVTPPPAPEPTPEPAAAPPAAIEPEEPVAPKSEPAAAKAEPPAAAKPEPAPAPAPAKRKGRKARPTVPSWEDVLLGTRSNR